MAEIGILLGVVLLVLCIQVVLLVLLAPYVLYASVLGFAGGLVFGLAEAVLVLAGIRAGRVRTPADVRAHGVGVPGGPRSYDYAWPHYFLGQVWYDLKTVAANALFDVRQFWQAGWRRLPRLPRFHARFLDVLPDHGGRTRSWTVLLGWPVLALPAATLAGLTVGVLVAVVAVGTASGTVTLLTWAVGVPSVMVQQGAERLRRRLRRTTSCCPNCYLMIELPVFTCPGRHSARDLANSDRHRMLQPGTQGVWLRRCGCGNVLPSGMPRAARTLAARCPKCGTSLPDGTGLATQVRVAVFGAAAAGKTALIDAGLAELPRRLEPTDFSVKRLEPAPATVGQPARTVTVALRRGFGRVLLQLFDARGAALVDRGVGGHGYFDDARNYLFVLDPFSVPAVHGGLAKVPPRLATAVRTASHDPADSYEAVVTGMRHRGVDTRRCRLAFVVTKADLLQAFSGGQRLERDSPAVRRWLDEQGLDNLVVGAERDFGDVRYFWCGSLTDRTHDPSAPLAWILSREGLLSAAGTGHGR
ncbi:hypothetical protein [Plantactinospora sp. WMMB782]|uniref:hypothetical protein n=1 Tax=Plantactinospora sp. WMMB782 TaxID=3404121 RepID=UPI003B92E072